jgi:hypothetical protein
VVGIGVEHHSNRHVDQVQLVQAAGARTVAGLERAQELAVDGEEVDRDAWA